MRKAIFLDKDGTLIKDVPYNADPSRLELFPDVGNALLSLKNAGYLLIMVTNQSGVAKGKFKEVDLKGIWNKLERDLAPFLVSLDAIYYCPHHPEGIIKEYARDCYCRKPKPGMLYCAASEFDVDLSKSWMIGDILNDVEAGNVAGCSTILIDNGNETEWTINKNRKPDYYAKGLREAAEIILSNKVVEDMGGYVYEKKSQKSY